MASQRTSGKSALNALKVNPLLVSVIFGGDLSEKMAKIVRNGSGDRTLIIGRIGSTSMFGHVRHITAPPSNYFLETKSPKQGFM